MDVSLYVLILRSLVALPVTNTNIHMHTPGGGMPTSTNRTKWPVQGGAIAVQPGWFQGHKTAFFYFNLGLGTVPPNMSHPMLAPIQIIGPSSEPYPGTFCLPQVPLPANITVNVGDHATIQVIETAIHGAALYNVGPAIYHPHARDFRLLTLCDAAVRRH